MSLNLKLSIAKDAGFCFGVKDAIAKAEESAQEFGKVYMLGDIVHNERVVHKLASKNVKVVESLDDVKGAPVLFRSHGTKPEIWKQAQASGHTIIDATCPLVLEIHEEIKKLETDNRKLIIIGDHGHDEVEGIKAQVENAIIVSSPKEARELPRYKRAGIITQSTQAMENIQEIISILLPKIYDMKFINTVCFPTRRNQEQIKELSANNDVMIIIGSYTSANTKRLVSVSKMINERSYQVENKEDIQSNWFNQHENVGITAGASSPQDLIDEIVEKLKEL